MRTVANAKTGGDIGAQALAFLDRQRLDQTPSNYALAYLRLSASESAAALAIDAITSDGVRITQAEADRIMSLYVKDASSEQVPSTDLAGLASVRFQAIQLADLAADAATATAAFGRDLTSELAMAGREGANLSMIVMAMVERSRIAEEKLNHATKRIEQLRHELDAAKADASQDALTGLSNRRGAEGELNRLRAASATCSIAICDIDHFKRINDEYGHAMGDRILRAVAASLAESCAPHRVARWGGEEFLVILPGVDLSAAVASTDRARLDLERRTYRIRETDKPLGAITISGGVAACLTGDVNQALRDADKLLYRAKADGRNRIVSALSLHT